MITFQKLFILTLSITLILSHTFQEIPIDTLFTPSDFQNLNIEKETTEKIKGLFDTEECLPSKSEAKEILLKDYGLSLDKNPDENLRFTIGKCNPVLFVPGIYATKLIGTINCKGLKEEKDIYKEMRVFCGDSVCKEDTIEEHPFFVALLDPATNILNTDSNKYSGCLGFFMQFFNKKDECPKMKNGKSVCYYSKNIQVGYYGSSDSTLDKGKCGLSAVENVIQSGNKAIDVLANQGAAKVYHQMIKRLREMGLREGFSYGAVPSDYRRFLATNKFATKSFRYQVERLYNNTGKPIVIVAHSYGTLLTLNNLVGDNKDLANKIKKFIAIAGPFAGSTKLLDVFLHGMHDWDVEFYIGSKLIKITNYNIFGQYFMYKSLPTIMELRPLPIIHKLFNDDKYSDFADAIRERLSLEDFCKKNRGKCNKDLIDERSVKFRKVFGNAFPDLTANECKLENHFLKYIKKGKEDMFDTPCMTEMFNIGECPTVLLKDENWDPNLDNINQLCGIKNNSLYYSQEECTKEKCVDNIYLEDGPYAFGDKEKIQFFIDRFNKNYKDEFGEIDYSYFESEESFKEKTKTLIEHHKKISKTQNLPIPPVDTDIVYATYNPTYTTFIFDKNKTDYFKDFLDYGGDDTVPNWSSLLTGFKWLYDKKQNNLKQEIRLVEFCSKLGKEGQFKFDEDNSKIFSAISCDCLDKNNKYVSNVKPCNHGAMISDSYLVKYMEAVVNNKTETIQVTEEKKKAVYAYNPNFDYNSKCNIDLRNMFLNEDE